jgi:branched-subunit amino acid ABC-type transport system permease component
METLFYQVMTGLAMGGNLFLVAAGLSLIFGVLNVVNFAHATFYLLAAYLAYTITAIFGPNGFWIALILAPLAAALLGAIVEITMFRMVYDKVHYLQLVVAWGLILMLGDGFKLIWGSEKRVILTPELLEGGVPIPGGTFPVALLFSMGMAAGMAIMLYFLLYRTKLGLYVRAARQDPIIPCTLGINVDALFTLVFAFACWLGGLGGVVASTMTPAYLGTDLEIILVAFIIVIVGGLGSVMGSLVGSLIYGLVTALGILVVPRFALVFLYALMILILIFRPYGLLGKPQLQ